MLSGKKGWIRYCWLAFVIVLGALFSTRSTEAAYFVRKISGVMPAYASVEFTSFKISPDGLFVVFKADIDQDTIKDLYSVPIHGGTPTRLSQSTLPERTIEKFEISSDSSRVVFLGDLNVSFKSELYSVPISGGVQTRLNEIMANNMDVSSDFEISPNSQTVVYRADQEEDEIVNVYAVPIVGGSVTKLNQDLTTTEDILKIDITQDGQKVIYLLFDQSSSEGNLYFTPLVGGEKKLLNTIFPGGGCVISFRTKPDSSGVVFYMQRFADTHYGLYASDFWTETGPIAYQLTGVSLPFLGDYEISPDSFWVVFNTSSEIYSVEASGSGSMAGLYGGTEEISTGWQITPNSLGVVFRIYDDTHNRDLLYSNYLDQLHTPTLLTPASMPDNSYVHQFDITPNNLGVVYRADQNVVGKTELFSVFINGTYLTQLTPSLPANGDVLNFIITPNSSAVVFRADGITDNVDEIFTTLITGGPIARISGPIIPPDGSVLNELLTPDGKKVVYSADAEINNKVELYMVEDVDLVFLPLLMK